MLRQDELAFVKAISSFQMSPAMLKELRLAMARRKKRPAVPAAKRSTLSGSRSGSRSSVCQQLEGNREANELASLDDTM